MECSGESQNGDLKFCLKWTWPNGIKDWGYFSAACITYTKQTKYVHNYVCKSMAKCMYVLVSHVEICSQLSSFSGEVELFSDHSST